MLANVQQVTIKPIITAAVAPGTLVHTDEYSIYARLPAWGYRHNTNCPNGRPVSESFLARGRSTNPAHTGQPEGLPV